MKIPQRGLRFNVLKVAVLLATYNGARYIEDQIKSIKAQDETTVSIYARDDGSSDGTFEILQRSDISLIKGEIFAKGAAQNFFNLICLSPIHEFEWVAFSDQDDIWMSDKLHRSLQAVEKFKSDCYSSSFISFNEDGHSVYVNKAGIIKEYDYIFQSPGPGCTFFIKSKLLLEFKCYLLASIESANRIKYHDSLIYYFARAAGKQWYIDATPTIYYRQHSNNVLGNNSGMLGSIKRLRMLRSRYFSKQLALFASIYKDDGDGVKIINSVIKFNIADRFFLLSKVFSFRRDYYGVLGLLFLFLFFKP